MCSQDILDDPLQLSGVKVVPGNECFQPLIRVSMVTNQEGDDNQKAVFSAGNVGVGGGCDAGASGASSRGE